MKVMVTGANGFTGSYLVKKLLARGYEVTGLVRKNSNFNMIENLPIKLIYKDIAKDSLDGLLDDIDIVYHVAAAFRAENVPRQYFWDVNVEGTRKLLVEAKRANVKRFVHTSTVGVQGKIKNPPAKEEYPYNPGDYYQESKMDGEKLALNFFKSENLQGTVVRPVGIYGPGDTRFLKLFKFINNGSFRMIGNGQVLYHITYVEDLVEGIALAGEKDEAVGEIITIGGEGFLTLEKLVEKIGNALDKPVIHKMKIPFWPIWTAGLICEIVCKPFQITPPIYRRRVDFFIKDRAFDISKAKSLLGFKPKVTPDEGLKITGNWYKMNGYLS